MIKSREMGGSGKRVAKAREMSGLIRRDGWLSQEIYIYIFIYSHMGLRDGCLSQGR